MTKRDDGCTCPSHCVGSACPIHGLPITEWFNEKIEEPMNKPDPITLPCVCHVPPPEGTVRLEIRKAKKGEWYWSESEHKWKQADKDFCFLEICVAIIAPQYDYPTPVEAMQLLSAASGPVECEFSDCDRWDVVGELGGFRKYGNEIHFIKKDSGMSWKKIRIPKRG